MASWQGFVEATPEFAQRVEELFTAHDRFRVDIEHVVLTSIDSGELMNEAWTPGRGLVRRQR